jgi:6-pyruvoyltetrahydropterin/6-carboxytetrahydropterin synthase
MAFLLAVETRFAAAHTLPGVGMCERLHGHNYRVRLTVRAEDSAVDPRGISVDLGDLDTIARECVADFEHQYLNDLEPFKKIPTSSEHIARIVCTRAARLLGAKGRVEQVEVWEQPHYRVTYRPAG